jgi:hypothetical protein
MALSDIVQVVISSVSVSPTRPGFGTPMIAAYHTHYTDAVRTYNLPNDLLSDGFLATDAAFLVATALKSQNPSVNKFKVGRRATGFTEAFTLSVSTSTAGDSVKFKLEGTQFSYTLATPTFVATGGRTLTVAGSAKTITASSGSFLADGWAVGQTVTVSGTTSNNSAKGAITTLTATVMTVSNSCSDEGPLSSAATLTANGPSSAGAANALCAAINTAAIATLAAVTATTNTLTVGAAAAGKVLHWAAWDPTKVDLENTTADPGLAADLATIAAADNDWYGLLLDSQGINQVHAAATYANANKKLFGYDCSDTVAIGSGSSDVFSVLKGLAYEHSYGVYNGQDSKQYSAAAAMGNRFPFDPGGDTWAFKTLKGVSPDTFTATQYTNLMGKNANIYSTIAGLNMLQFGKSADGEFIDTIRFIDWLQSRIQINVFSALAAMPKIPFTDAGVSVVKGMILAALQDGERAGGLTPGSSLVTAPLVSSISSIDKGNRNLPNVQFSAQLAGAIHSVSITGVISV